MRGVYPNDGTCLRTPYTRVSILQGTENFHNLEIPDSPSIAGKYFRWRRAGSLMPSSYRPSYMPYMALSTSHVRCNK